MTGRNGHSHLTALIHANVVIAAAGAGVAITATWVLGHPFDPLPIVLVFTAVFLAYTVNRFTDREADGHNLPGRAAFVHRHGKPLLVAAILVYASAGVATAALRPGLVALLVLPPVLAVAYATPWVRRIPLFKNAVVGVCWAVIPLGIGAYHGNVGSATVVVAALFGGLLTIAAMVFDIKDVEGDRLVGTRTVPTWLGPTRTRQVALGSVLALLPAVAAAAILLSSRFAVFGLYAGYLALVIPFAEADRGPLFYGGVIDGEHVLVAATVVVWAIVG